MVSFPLIVVCGTIVIVVTTILARRAINDYPAIHLAANEDVRNYVINSVYTSFDLPLLKKSLLGVLPLGLFVFSDFMLSQIGVPELLKMLLFAGLTPTFIVLDSHKFSLTASSSETGVFLQQFHVQGSHFLDDLKQRFVVG